MDCKVYFSDGQIVHIQNIKNIKAVRNNADAESPARMMVAIYNDEDPMPVASFYDIRGYELIGRAKNI